MKAYILGHGDPSWPMRVPRATSGSVMVWVWDLGLQSSGSNCLVRTPEDFRDHIFIGLII